jgi:hypothetical protein
MKMATIRIKAMIPPQAPPTTADTGNETMEKLKELQ